MRVVGGSLAGRRLAALGGGAADAALRPTSDKVRESLFNIIEHGDYPPLKDARVLDLFAGTGALAIEALSRGAARAILIDDHPKARGLIRENLEALGLNGVAKIFRRDVTRLGPNRSAPFTHIFLDPPYGRGLGEKAIASAFSGGWVAPDALIVLEEVADAEVCVEGAEAVDRRLYGDTQILMLRPGA